MKNNRTLEKGKAQNLAELAAYTEGGVTSKTLSTNSGGSITFFSFDKGQALSEHSAPFDAFLQVIEGSAEIRIAGVTNIVKRGEFIIMPENVPHAVNAIEKFKMLLVMLKGN
ncbi:MAG: cupin [Lentisphaerae bacterium GWF2_45_14]|nr:MAG: cupin [Lentisphaerae bacterium GWF2_45_14]